MLADVRPPTSEADHVAVESNTGDSFKFTKFSKKSDDKAMFFDQLRYVYVCVRRASPVKYFYACKTKFLDTGEDGKKRTLLPCELIVTQRSLDLRFESGRTQTFQLKHVRRWGHKSVRLSIILGGRADHLRMATRSVREAENIVQYLNHIAFVQSKRFKKTPPQ